MKDKKEFIEMTKGSFVSRLSSIADAIIKGKPKYNNGDLIEENWFIWIMKNIGHLGNTHYSYQRYPVQSTTAGKFKIQKPETETVTIALLSDWASDTCESRLIAEQTGESDYSIHMGDTYYVGNELEIANNFYKEKGGSWPYGKLGSFAMLGNHEMYSSGKDYFKLIAARMGNFTKPVKQPQDASFFTLENKYWRIIGLDTGYNSLKGFFGIENNYDLDLHEWQKAWLKKVVRLSDDNRGLIILSHHQIFSAFEKRNFPKPQEYIAELVGPNRSVIWLVGHEHWMAVYGKNPIGNNSFAYARCIGNSGMPVELERKGTAKKPSGADPGSNYNLVLYDKREREKYKNNIPLGFNGFVKLNLLENNLIIDYYDDNNKSRVCPRLIVKEKWSIDISTGILKGVSIENLTEGNETDEQLTPLQPINVAIE